MVVANEAHGRTGTESHRPGVVTHVGCSVVAAVLTVGFLVVVGVGTLFAVLSALGYLSTTVFVWLVLVWWVVWWLVAELAVDRMWERARGGGAQSR
jgi:hypothetical protein